MFLITTWRVDIPEKIYLLISSSNFNRTWKNVKNIWTHILIIIHYSTTWQMQIYCHIHHHTEEEQRSSISSMRGGLFLLRPVFSLNMMFLSTFRKLSYKHGFDKLKNILSVKITCNFTMYFKIFLPGQFFESTVDTKICPSGCIVRNFTQKSRSNLAKNELRKLISFTET